MLLPAREAAERLGVKVDTLYAYVSRGFLRSMEVVGSRERHYDVDEVEHFRAARGVTRTRPVAETLSPVIGSAICLIENHRLYYRGKDALHLVETASLEDVAAILWKAELQAPAAADPGLLPARRAREHTVSSRHPPYEKEEGVQWEGERQLPLIERCQVRLACRSAVDLAALDLSQTGVIRTGRNILAELAACVADGKSEPQRVHEQLAIAWRLDAAGADIVRRCLVLLAEHELNASTYVARCVASTGATLYAVVSAALAALSGRRHGGASASSEALFRELSDGADPMQAIAARLARGEAIPGLGQPLYPDGDPRAPAIIEAVAAAKPEAGARIVAAVRSATQLTGEYPNVDFALGAVAVALDLPRGAALGLFLVARSVGWIAHAIEQYESGILIRPRARYTGRR